MFNILISISMQNVNEIQKLLINTFLIVRILYFSFISEGINEIIYYKLVLFRIFYIEEKI